jgi:hypothetical protein
MTSARHLQTKIALKILSHSEKIFGLKVFVFLQCCVFHAYKYKINISLSRVAAAAVVCLMSYKKEAII